MLNTLNGLALGCIGLALVVRADDVISNTDDSDPAIVVIGPIRLTRTWTIVTFSLIGAALGVLLYTVIRLTDCCRVRKQQRHTNSPTKLARITSNPNNGSASASSANLLGPEATHGADQKPLSIESPKSLARAQSIRLPDVEKAHAPVTRTPTRPVVVELVTTVPPEVFTASVPVTPMLVQAVPALHEVPNPSAQLPSVARYKSQHATTLLARGSTSPVGLTSEVSETKLVTERPTTATSATTMDKTPHPQSAGSSVVPTPQLLQIYANALGTPTSIGAGRSPKVFSAKRMDASLRLSVRAMLRHQSKSKAGGPMSALPDRAPIVLPDGTLVPPPDFGLVSSLDPALLRLASSHRSRRIGLSKKGPSSPGRNLNSRKLSGEKVVVQIVEVDGAPPADPRNVGEQGWDDEDDAPLGTSSPSAPQDTKESPSRAIIPAPLDASLADSTSP
ncbi:hypothetical protein HDU93_006113, partial [Gonapodya sp. JEL0774]